MCEIARAGISGVCVEKATVKPVFNDHLYTEDTNPKFPFCSCDSSYYLLLVCGIAHAILGFEYRYNTGAEEYCIAVSEFTKFKLLFFTKTYIIIQPYLQLWIEVHFIVLIGK